jgi:predicted nucleic acid-binding protein
LVDRVHLDNDFVVFAILARGPERRRLYALVDAGAIIEMSAVAWYEFCRGPRDPEQLALAAEFLGPDRIIPFDSALAERAGDVFRRLGSPRKRAQDIAIGVTALASGATLYTRNARDFRGIEGLEVEATVRRRGVDPR